MNIPSYTEQGEVRDAHKALKGRKRRKGWSDIGAASAVSYVFLESGSTRPFWLSEDGEGQRKSGNTAPMRKERKENFTSLQRQPLHRERKPVLSRKRGNIQQQQRGLINIPKMSKKTKLKAREINSSKRRQRALNVKHKSSRI